VEDGRKQSKVVDLAKKGVLLRKNNAK